MEQSTKATVLENQKEANVSIVKLNIDNLGALENALENKEAKGRKKDRGHFTSSLPEYSLLQNISLSKQINKTENASSTSKNFSPALAATSSTVKSTVISRSRNDLIGSSFYEIRPAKKINVYSARVS